LRFYVVDAKLTKKLVVGFTLILLVMIVLEREIYTARASGVIYIRPDGSIFPSSAPISTIDGRNYLLTGPISDEIVVQRSNINIDGNNQTVRGTGGGYGFTLNSINGVVITNTNVRGFGEGFWLSSSFNISIVGNRITENTITGISLYSSSNNNIDENDLAGGRYGIYLVSSSENNIRRNSLISTEVSGISFEAYSNNNTVASNMFVGSGVLVSSSFGNVLEENTVNSKPLVFLEGVSGRAVTDAGQVVLVNCNQIHVENLDLANTSVGVELWATVDSRILGNNITASYYGVWLCDSSNNSIAGNNFTGNNRGIQLWWSSNNSFFHNNLINNTSQVDDLAWEDPEVGFSVNIWDECYPSGGNYWSDHVVMDEKKGQDQNVTGSDGICDVPYEIDGDNQDRFPLAHPYRKLLGDINGDRHVDILDAISLANAFNSKPGDANWNPNADFNGDGRVNILDAITLASNFG
jgi:parallel beta-helix repeat protein